MIKKSKPLEDWSKVGYRGIMLNNGTLWLSEEGKLIAINYQSKTETKRRDELIEIERGKLHEAIRKFKKPIKVIEISKYRIRIDYLEENYFRYSSWSINKRMNEEPDLILENGKEVFDGSGGNHRFIFKNGKYTYEYSIIVMGRMMILLLV